MTEQIIPPTTLVAKLTGLLGVDARGMPLPPPNSLVSAAFELSNEAAESLKQCQAVVMTLTKQTLALNDRMVLLQAACEEARLMPRTDHFVHPKLVMQVPVIAALLREQPQAAKLVGPAVLRFGEVRSDIMELTEALKRGEVSPNRVEQVRGKYLFLCKVQVYFRDVPLIHQLFATPAEPAAPPAPDPLPGARAAVPLPKLNALPGGAPVLSPRRPNLTGPLNGPDQLNLGQARPKTGPLPSRPGLSRPGMDQLSLGGRSKPAPTVQADSARFAVQGQVFLKALEVKMLILQASCELALGLKRNTQSLLPLPAHQTVRNLSGMLTQSPPTLADAQNFLTLYHEARTLSKNKNQANLRELSEVLTRVSTFPHKFRGNVMLEQLFLVS